MKIESAPHRVTSFSAADQEKAGTIILSSILRSSDFNVKNNAEVHLVIAIPNSTLTYQATIILNSLMVFA